MNAKIDVTGVRLESERLILREWNLDDLDDFFEYASVPGVGELAGWEHHANKEVSLKILTHFIENKKTFAIIYKENNKAIGSLGVEFYGAEDKLSEFDNYQGREIGYVLSKDYWGKGIMPEAVRLVIDYLFNKLDYDFLLCGYYDYNRQSRRVQEKCGFLPYRRLTFTTKMGKEEKGILNLMINPHKDIKFEFSHPETLIYDTVFETDRLRFRKIVQADFESLKKIIGDPENEKEPADDKMVQRWIDWCLSSYKKDNFGMWATLLKESNEMIGISGISMQFIDDMWKPEVGYHLRKDYHHQGLGKEMARGIRDYFFNHYDYDEVYSYMEEDNIASSKVAEANDMTFLHLYKTPQGKLCKVYKITREEWKKKSITK